MSNLKFSRQRESIKEYLANTKEHPTADMIYMSLRETNPNLSLGTVYRNLNLLVEQGEIIKISNGSGSDRYDCNSKPHFHFKCTECSCVQDIELAPGALDHINLIASANFDGEITGHTTSFYGLCANCKTKH